MDDEREQRPPLRERIRAAGGFYRWWNSRLIRYAGPASVGPYETEPEPVRTERACPLCGQPMSALGCREVSANPSTARTTGQTMSGMKAVHGRPVRSHKAPQMIGTATAKP